MGKKKVYIEDLEKDLKRPNSSTDVPAPELSPEEVQEDLIYRDLYEVLKKNEPKNKKK